MSLANSSNLHEQDGIVFQLQIKLYIMNSHSVTHSQCFSSQQTFRVYITIQRQTETLRDIQGMKGDNSNYRGDNFWGIQGEYMGINNKYYNFKYYIDGFQDTQGQCTYYLKLRGHVGHTEKYLKVQGDTGEYLERRGHTVNICIDIYSRKKTCF